MKYGKKGYWKSEKNLGLPTAATRFSFVEFTKTNFQLRKKCPTLSSFLVCHPLLTAANLPMSYVLPLVNSSSAGM
jgi:hypothetical protein